MNNTDMLIVMALLVGLIQGGAFVWYYMTTRKHAPPIEWQYCDILHREHMDDMVLSGWELVTVYQPWVFDPSDRCSRPGQGSRAVWKRAT